MARIAYVNGRYLGLDARAGAGPIAIEDRGYQFADGVYEVVKVVAGRPRDLDRHLARLGRSLAALDMPPPMARCCARSGAATGSRPVCSISRSAAAPARAKHLYAPQTRPSLVVTVRSPGFPDEAEAALSSTSSWLLPVVAIDGRPIGDGRPGPVVRRLMARYQDHVRSPGGGAGVADAVSGWQING